MAHLNVGHTKRTRKSFMKGPLMRPFMTLLTVIKESHVSELFFAQIKRASDVTIALIGSTCEL